MRKINQILKVHHILYIVPILALLFITHNTSALSYQNNTNMEFTFNPTLSISLSGSLSLLELQPGTSADSNVISINVSTNNVTGYTLTANVGNSSYPTTSLVHDDIGGSNDYQFTNLSSNITNLSDFNDNEWGYSYAVNDNATWSNYSGLPIYTSANNKTIHEATTPSHDSIKFKVGAKASSTQVAGTYTNVVNFYTITNPAPATFADAFAAAGKEPTASGYYKMQDMTHSICEAADMDTNIQLIDIRDSQIYWVGKAKDGNCWMLQDLKIGKNINILELTSDASDVDSNGFILDGKLADGKFHSYIIDGITGQNNSSEYYCTDSYGCYYNWYTATAGSGTTASASDAEYSICPTNWDLPSAQSFISLKSYYSSIASMLVDNPSTSYDNVVGKIPGFLLGGDYNNYGVEGLNKYGIYWNSYVNPYDKRYSGDFFIEPSMASLGSNSKYLGRSIRCLAR